MSKKHPELPEGYQPKGRWYYRVRAEGKKRVWVKITLIRNGLPAFYRKLSEIAADDIAPDRIPAVVALWQQEIQPSRAAKTQENDEWVMGAIAEAFAEFRAHQVTTPLCVEFLKDYRDRPRTHNLMRSGLLELFRFCECKAHNGEPYRKAGSNPIPAIPRMKTPPRKKYATDSELRRIKHAALVGKDGRRTRSGPYVCALIDMAYLTGQRVGDLLDLRWTKRAALDAGGEVVAPYIGDDAIYFQPDKTVSTTGAKVAITWTPKLRQLVERIKAMGRRHLTHVFTNQDAQPLGYSTFATAWWRACDRAGIKNLHFHDIRAKALTDTEEQHGMQAARRKGAHATERQTADYLAHRKAQKSEATK